MSRILENSSEHKVLWFLQDWDDPDLYQIKSGGEIIEILSLNEAYRKYSRDEYTILVQEWDDLDEAST